MTRGPVDIGEEDITLNQEDMASDQETTGPNRQPRDRRAAKTETARLKGQETRHRNYEKGMEKQRLATLATEEQRLKRRKRDKGSMKETFHQAKKAAAIGNVPIGCVIVCGNRIMAREYNRCNTNKSVLSHAETISVRKAYEKMGD